MTSLRDSVTSRDVIETVVSASATCDVTESLDVDRGVTVATCDVIALSLATVDDVL